MRRGCFIGLFLVALLSLPPMAYASPPDETWIGGWFDNADYDDIVLIVMSAVGTLDSLLVQSITVGETVVATVPQIDENAPLILALSSPSTRAPPVAA